MTLYQFSKFHATRSIRGAIALSWIGVLAACQSAPVSPTPIAPTPTPSIPSVTAPPLPAPDKPITLTLWLPTRFTPQDDNPATRVLQQQLHEFARSADGVPSQVIVKQDHGPGGLLDLLRTASPVAPSVLPDVIALDSDDLETAASAGLVQPIDTLLPADLIADLFPFARDMVTLNGKVYGIIYSADLPHLVTKDKAIPPISWAEVLSNTRRYIFAVRDSSPGVSDAVLADYHAAGGKLIAANGQAMLDPAALKAVLEQYRQAQTKNILPPNIVDLSSTTDVWNAWRSSAAAVGQINATEYLSAAASLPDTQFAALPASARPAEPIGRGWAYAIAAREPRRQAAAARLLQYLMSPQNSGTWTQAARVLPGRAGSFAAWDQSDPYTGFIRDQLAQAQAAPPQAIINIVGPAMRKAVEDVLSGSATPEEAAQAAAKMVNQNP